MCAALWKPLGFGLAFNLGLVAAFFYSLLASEKSIVVVIDEDVSYVK